MMPTASAIRPLEEGVSRDQTTAFFERYFPACKMDRVLLVTPPDGSSEMFRFDTAKRRRYPNYPPYGLGVIAEQLRRTGVEPRIVNLNHTVLVAAASMSEQDFDFDAVWRAELNRTIDGFDPDLIGVTCMFTMTHQSLKLVCQEAAKSGAVVAVGGVHVTNDVERILDDIPEARVAFVREGDVAIQRFCEVVRRKIPVEMLGQVILNAGNGLRLRDVRAVQPSAEEIDVMPAYDLFKVNTMSRYGVIGGFHGFKGSDTGFATVLSNRGCRAQCTFCSVRNFNGKAVRQRSVNSVLDELEFLENEQDIRHIVWLDDDLLKDRARALALFNGMVQRNLELTWDATNGLIAASCDEEMVHAMAASGCIGCYIGMESGNPEILKRVKKPGTVHNFLAAAEAFRQYPQIHARVFLMLGFPGETLRMICDTMNVAREMDLDWYGVTPLQPLPNTPIYDSMVEQGLIQAVGSTDVRFMSGGYGKQDEVDGGQLRAAQTFEEAFRAIPLDVVPTQKQIYDIWSYMQYHLNFHRLFFEARPVKLQQQMHNLRTLADKISPEHGFALYFLGYLQHLVNGDVGADVICRLERTLASNPYWQDRFDAFGLCVDDLKVGHFPNKSFPRLEAGTLPIDARRYEDLVSEP